MSAVVETPAVTATTAPAREALSETALREIRSGHVVLLAGNTSDLSDTSRDAYYYTDGRVDITSGQFSAYSLDVNGDIQAWTTESASRIVEHTSTDHGSWKQKTAWKRAPGMIANINPSYLSGAVHDKAREITPNKNLPRYATFVEVLSVDEPAGTAQVRVFTHTSDTPDAIEYGEDTLNTGGVSLNLLTPEKFNTLYALSKDVWPAGSLWTYEGDTVIVEANRGVTARFRSADDVTGEAITGPTATVKELTTEYRSYVSKVADSAEAYRKSLPSDEVREAVNLLSRNTVTRALKHADSNDYCKETAVALTSAGHVIPEIRIKGTITIDVDFTTKEYMFLRRAFGMANDDVSNLAAVLKDNYRRLAEQSGGKLPAMSPTDTTKFDLDASVVWKTPKLRPLA